MARPLVGGILRSLVVVLPVSAGVAASLTFDHFVHHPSGFGAMAAWLLGSFTAAGISAYLVERAARQLLPLAALLRMALLFPDTAPSRFKIARTAANPARLAELAEHTEDVRSAAAAEVLALLAQLTRHDRHTRGHSERVRVFSDLLAEEMGIRGLDRDKLRWGALLHDIGKISVPATILNKKGRPTPEEWAVVQGHPEAGEVIAGPLFGWLGEWAGAITEHHERYDGGGYPTGIPTSQLSLAGRIVAVTDAYETMTAARSYKKPMATAAARQELTDCAGKQFDPDVVRAFLLISLSRVTRAVGPLSWLLHLPFAARLQLIGAQATAGISGAAAPVAALGVGTLTAAALTVSGTLPAAAASPVARPAVTHTSHHSRHTTTHVSATVQPSAPRLVAGPVAIHSSPPLTKTGAPAIQSSPKVHPSAARKPVHRGDATPVASSSPPPASATDAPAQPAAVVLPAAGSAGKSHKDEGNTPPPPAGKSPNQPAGKGPDKKSAKTKDKTATAPPAPENAPAPPAGNPNPNPPAAAAPAAAPPVADPPKAPPPAPTPPAAADSSAAGAHEGAANGGLLTLQQVVSALAAAAAAANAGHGGHGPHGNH